MAVELNQSNFIGIWEILIVLSIIGFILGVVIFIRNNSVLKFRLRLIELVSEIDKEEIDKYLGYTGWRLREIGSVSYNEMVLKFWRSSESFYVDKKSFQEIKQRQKRAFEKRN